MDTRLDRRHALRLLGGAALATIPALKFAGGAEAGITWCRADPKVELAGVPVKIDIAVPADKLDLVTGPTLVHISVPASVTREFIWADEGLNGLGYVVTFNEKMKSGKVPEHFTAKIRVTVQTADDARIPIAVYCTPADGEPSEYLFEDPKKTRVTVKFKVNSRLADTAGDDNSQDDGQS